jgi:hypothetical protein
MCDPLSRALALNTIRRTSECSCAIFPRLPNLDLAYCGAVAPHLPLPSEARRHAGRVGEVNSRGAMATLHGNGQIPRR